jgi:hypothetical protein
MERYDGVKCERRTGASSKLLRCLGAVAAWPERLAMLTRSTGKRSRLGLNQWALGSLSRRWLGEGTNWTAVGQRSVVSKGASGLVDS